MLVFFRRVPEKTKHRDLIAFIGPAMKSSWFRKQGLIVDIKVVHLQRYGSDCSEFHGLVTVEPEAAARRMIKCLNGKSLLGKHIVVREYHYRLWHNDPRVDFKTLHPKECNQRLADRRRYDLEVVKDDLTKFSGDKAFHRQHK